MITTKFHITNRTQDAADKELNNLFDELVPNSGKATTKAGEIVRAMARLAYRWYNDGDKLGEGYGRETCNPAARFLCDKVQGIAHKLGKIYAVYNNDDYEQGLLHVQNYVIDFINANPQLKTEANDENYLDWRDDEEDVDDTEEY